MGLRFKLCAVAVVVEGRFPGVVVALEGAVLEDRVPTESANQSTLQTARSVRCRDRFEVDDLVDAR